jgi:hypothetical protein
MSLFINCWVVQGKEPYFSTDLFFKSCLCCSYTSQWNRICHGFCLEKLSQKHLLSFLNLNLCMYVLNVPCPVMNWVVYKLLVQYCVHFCRSIIVGKNVFVWHPFSDVLHLRFHWRMLYSINLLFANKAYIRS